MTDQDVRSPASRLMSPEPHPRINLLFLMMSDIYDPTQRVGRGTLGGNPGGVVSGETFRWWKRMVEENRSSIIISAHHYVLKNTTVASGEWEGMQRDENGGWKP